MLKTCFTCYSSATLEGRSLTHILFSHIASRQFFPLSERIMCHELPELITLTISKINMDWSYVPDLLNTCKSLQKWMMTQVQLAEHFQNVKNSYLSSFNEGSYRSMLQIPYKKIKQVPKMQPSYFLINIIIFLQLCSEFGRIMKVLCIVVCTSTILKRTEQTPPITKDLSLNESHQWLWISII